MSKYAWTLKKGPSGCPESSVNTNVRCVTFQKCEYLVAAATKAWNHAKYYRPLARCHFWETWNVLTMSVQYRGMATLWRKRDRNMTIEFMSFHCERRLTETWQWSLCRFRRQHALYRRLSHTKCSTSGSESSTPHRTGDKTTLLDSKYRPSRLHRIFFPHTSGFENLLWIHTRLVSCYGEAHADV